MNKSFLEEFKELVEKHGLDRDMILLFREGEDNMQLYLNGNSQTLVDMFIAAVDNDEHFQSIVFQAALRVTSVMDTSHKN